VTRPRPTTAEERASIDARDMRALQRRGRGVGSRGGPTGSVAIWAGDAPPSGALLCQGQVVARSSYPLLFATIGTKYGAGDGSTTFALPDLRFRVPVGQHTGMPAFDTVGETGGSVDVTLTTAQIPSHSHQQQFASNAVAPGGGGAVGGMTSVGGVSLVPAEQFTLDTGGGAAHNNMPPYVVMNYIIYI